MCSLHVLRVRGWVYFSGDGPAWSYYGILFYAILLKFDIYIYIFYFSITFIIGRMFSFENIFNFSHCLRSSLVSWVGSRLGANGQCHVPRPGSTVMPMGSRRSDLQGTRGSFQTQPNVLYDDRVIQNSYMGINTFFSIFCFKRVWDYDSYNHLILFHGIISSLFWNVNLSLKAQLQPTYSRQYLPQSWIITVWLSVPPIP